MTSTTMPTRSLSMPSSIDSSWLLATPGSAPGLRHMRISLAGGLVAGISPAGPPESPTSAPRRLALPALSNAHDHARTFRSSTLDALGYPLESWLPFMGTVPDLDPYLCAATSFTRSVRHGVANLMVHYTRAQGGMPYVDEAREVARAASDIGVRIGFAIAIRDRYGIAYDDDAAVLKALRPGIRDAVERRLSVKAVGAAQHLALVNEVAAMVAADGYAENVNVQYGPTAVQWCSTPLLEAIARASADTGRGIHMHMLETKYQREWADKAHPEGIIEFLDSIGFLSPRLTLAHCVYARPDELALLAERGVTIAVNTSSNLGLKSGIAPLAEMLRQGCRVAMGLDGMAFDEDDDALRELRLGYALHRGWGYDENLSREQLWAFAAGHGPRGVGGLNAPSSGRIAVGEPADLILLDWDAIDNESLFDDVDPLQQLLGRANGTHIDKVLIGGRLVVDGGKIQGIDEAALNREFLAAARSALASDAGHLEWRQTVKALAADLGPLYRGGHFGGCC